MKYRDISAVLGLSSLMLVGCGSGLTTVQPRVLGPHELYLQYDNEFQIASPEGMVATGLTYNGLTEYVGCVPEAARHAEAAESSGKAAVGMTAVGIGLGIGGLGGLAGLAFENNQDVMTAFLLAGLGAEVVGLILTATGRGMKVEANGNAVDAVNFYNDAVGSRGGRCGPRGAEIPQPPPTAAPTPAPIYPVPPSELPPAPPIKPWPVQTNQEPPDRVILPQ